MLDKTGTVTSGKPVVTDIPDEFRAAADDAETICGEDYWPLPSYSKMLYYV